MKKVLAVLFVVALWAGAANAADTVLGVNFSTGWSGPHVGMGAHPTQTADGFSNWTDSSPISGSEGASSGTGLVVLGSDGGVTVDWSGSNWWYAGPEDNAENALYRAYLDDGGNGPLITIHGLSAWLASVGANAYTVRLYQNTDWDNVSFLTTNLTDGTNILQSLTPTNMWVSGDGTRAFVDSGILTVNTLVIDGAKGPTDGKRGCISAFKITSVVLKIGNNLPANGAVNIPVARTSPDNDLVFTINDPNIQKVDVQFGTENDPNLTSKPAYKIVADMAVTPGQQYTVNLESLAADLSYVKTYYWKVIGYEPNALAPSGFDPVPGLVSSFTTKPLDASPIVDAGNNVITTLVLSSSPNVLTLHGSVTDDGVSPQTVIWKAYDVAFGGGLTTKVTFANQTDPNTTVTISESGTYILNLSATDGTGTVSDQKQIVVYDSDCDAAKATGTRVANYYDRDDNCVVNLLDFAVFASEWLDSTDLTESYLRTKTVTAGTNNALVAEYWTGVSGTDPNNLLADSRYPASPSGSYLVVGQLSGSLAGDTYGQRIRGYIVPQTSGTYTFYIASDDGSRLFLSADTTPVDTNPVLRKQIAEVPNGNWTDANQWTKFPEQKSAPVTLTAGQYYYVEILHKENTGGENVSVGWSTDGGTTITVVPGAVLRYGL